MRIGFLLICHFIADFLFQSRKTAVEKSSKLLTLFFHCVVNFLVFFIGGILITGNIIWSFCFAYLNAILHGLIDWNIWRGYKCLRRNVGLGFKYWVDHFFYVIIGFDQLLHALSILIAISFANLRS